MSRLKSSAMQRDLPPWALIVFGAAAVVILGFIGWRIATAREPDAGPPMHVYPGMYDLRAARQSAGQTGGAAPAGK